MHVSPRLHRRHQRRLTVLAGVAFAAAAFTSCGGDSDAGASGATVLEVELGRYTITPATLAAPAGELELVVTNVDDALVHNLVVAGKGTRQLAPGETQTLPMGAIAIGEYRMWCDVQGHAQAGQTGALRIDPAPATAEPTATGG